MFAFSVDETSCISFLFYIKPQRPLHQNVFHVVVFPFSSTSNHNRNHHFKHMMLVVFPFSSTSNHNIRVSTNKQNMVVFPFSSTSNHNTCYVMNPNPKVVFPFSSTSNHNLLVVLKYLPQLYFLSLLHQTTTGGTSYVLKYMLYFLSPDFVIASPKNFHRRVWRFAGAVALASF